MIGHIHQETKTDLSCRETPKLRLHGYSHASALKIRPSQRHDTECQLSAQRAFGDGHEVE